MVMTFKNANDAIDAHLRPLRQARALVEAWPETVKWQQLLDKSDVGATLAEVTVIQRMIKEGMSTENAGLVMELWKQELALTQFLGGSRSATR
jgi:hypothetical protein